MSRAEDGFTLVELLISTVILAIIFGVVTEAMIVGLRTTDTTDQRLRESIDRQFVATYFVGDVQSADQVNPTGSTCGSGTPLVTFAWTDGSTAKVSSYLVGTASADERLLTRSYCEGGVVKSQKALARYLGSGTAASVTCDSSTCAAASTPRNVTISVTAASGPPTFSVTGTRRDTT